MLLNKGHIYRIFVNSSQRDQGVNVPNDREKENRYQIGISSGIIMFVLKLTRTGITFNISPPRNFDGHKILYLRASDFLDLRRRENVQGHLMGKKFDPTYLSRTQS